MVVFVQLQNWRWVFVNVVPEDWRQLVHTKYLNSESTKDTFLFYVLSKLSFLQPLIEASKTSRDSRGYCTRSNRFFI